MEDCLAPGVPKIGKANGAMGPLIPRKENRYGLWRKDKLETYRQGKSHRVPVACMVTVKFPQKYWANWGEVGVGWRVRIALRVGSAKMEGGEHSPSSPGCQGCRTGGGGQNWGEGREKGGHCLDDRATHKGRRERTGSGGLLLYR